MNFNQGPFGEHQNSVGIHVNQSLLRGFPIKMHGHLKQKKTRAESPHPLLLPVHKRQEDAEAHGPSLGAALCEIFARRWTVGLGEQKLEKNSS